MRRAHVSLLLSLVVMLGTTGFSAGTQAAASPVVQLPMGPGPLISENIEYVATIPLDSPGVGGKVRMIDGHRYFFITGEKGLAIYQIDNPRLPMLVSLTPFPHSEDEDVQVSDDGKRVVMVADGGLPVPILINQGVHVWNTSNLAAPVKVASATRSTHTAACADPGCNYIYGSTGYMYDATRANEGIITEKGQWNIGPTGTAIGGRHALNRDDAGIIVSDSSPRMVLDPRPHIGRDGTEYGYLRPEVLAIGSPRTAADSRLQHNNKRPNAGAWAPRDADNPGDAIAPLPAPAANGSIVLPAGSLRPGEMLVGNSESNINPTCSMSGALSTWDMRDFDKGRTPVQLDVFHPANGTYADGDPALNASGCSGHWFTVNGTYVAASWYDHGVRIMGLSMDTGKITEVGYFQPVVAMGAQSVWVTDEYIYAVDYERGIDILRFDADGPRPTDAQRLASWYAAPSVRDSGLAVPPNAYWCLRAGDN